MSRPAAAPPDRFALYELCAQSPRRDALMLRAVHGGDATVLAEDFCAAAALSRAWVAFCPRNRAIATDKDAGVLDRCRATARLTKVHADLLESAPGALPRTSADVVAVLNYSICEIHTRAALVEYLARARSRLKRGGVFVCDIYGGADAFNTGTAAADFRTPDGLAVRYTWQQRSADPLTGRVVNAMHFRVTPPGGKPRTLRDAFVYNWRLWSVPELRDAMHDAGFREVRIYTRSADAVDESGDLHATPIADPGELDDSYSLLITASTSRTQHTP